MLTQHLRSAACAMGAAASISARDISVLRRYGAPLRSRRY
jgi:hypothetical protein